VNIEFTTETSLSAEATLDGQELFVRSYGKIIDSSEAGEQIVGELRVVMLDVWRAAEEGIDLWDAADAADGDMEALVSTFFEDGELRASVLHGLHFASNHNLLYIDRVEINEEYRGNGLALAAIDRAIQILGEGCGYAAIKPLPLQFVGKVSKSDPKAVKGATTKLRKHYRRMGFRNLGRSNFMAMNLDTRRPNMLLS
jgi:hypothetical protein